MKKTFFISLLFVLVKSTNGQNVGIGTNSPSAKLHVNGTSRFQGNGTFTDNLVVENSLTAQSILSETSLRVTGNSALGGAVDNNFRLRVYDGNTRLGGDAQVTGNMAIGGDLDNLYRLRVYDGNARIGGEFHATGNVGIGSTPDANYKLRVYAGNSRFDGNATITGELNVSDVDITNTLTIDGKGSVRSNGSSPLRIGFDTKWVNVFIANNARVSVTANIADFEGDVNDVRVMVSHVINDGGFLPWPEMIITPMVPDPVTNTVTIWITNKSGENGVLTGTIYLTTIAKN